MVLTDNETKVDLLNNEAIAKTIINLIRSDPDRPVTVGVHGDWGAGKSSVLEMIDAALESEKEILCIKFNGWRFQGFEDAKIALLEGIVAEIGDKRSVVSGLVERVKALFRRIDWLKLAKKAGGLALAHGSALAAAAAGQGELAHTIATATATKAVLALGEKAAAKGGESDATGLLKPVEEQTVPEQIKAFRKDFDKLLESAGIKQLVVLIDDLDRCLPDTAIETLEAVRLFVFTSKTAFVVAADEAMIEYAVRKHFPELPDTTGPRDYARNYLEKLIQVPFRIPALGETETRVYVTLLLVGSALGEKREEFSKLVGLARERLKRPWRRETLDASALKTALGEHSNKAESALTLSEQLGPMLASGTRGNPRQIKRFLNSLQLRHATAQARGFGDEVRLPQLAKLMLAERFIPRLFDQIAMAAATDPNGRCADLSALESAATETPSAGSGKKAATAKEVAAGDTPKANAESAVLTEWLVWPQALSWARLQPALGEVDLRPYLFVAKDRKDFFGVSALGHLAAVVDRLMGRKLVVQAAESDLKGLASAEAGQVFDALCSRVLVSDGFEAEPDGIAGLQVLVKAHPVLQMQLVDFLARLPPERVGPWVVGGWAGVIIDGAASSRFDEFLDKLHQATKSQMVRSAITMRRAKKVH